MKFKKIYNHKFIIPSNVIHNNSYISFYAYSNINWIYSSETKTMIDYFNIILNNPPKDKKKTKSKDKRAQKKKRNKSNKIMCLFI